MLLRDDGEIETANEYSSDDDSRISLDDCEDNLATPKQDEILVV